MEWLESIWSDFQYALRTFRRMPTFTVIATITLALGIGATTAMFTLVNSILLRPLPYPQSERIVRVIQSYPEKGLDTWGLSQQNIALYRDRSTDFEAFAAYRGGSATVRSESGPQRLAILRVTAEFFRAIGVGPAMGRTFTAEEDSPGKNNVVIISHGTWQTRFGGNASVLGTTMEIDGQIVRIVGVMPPSFAFPKPDVGAWLPMGLDPNRGFGYFNSGIGDSSLASHRNRRATDHRDHVGLGSINRARRRGREVDRARPMKTIVIDHCKEVFVGRSASAVAASSAQ
jgi:hypothetical protein